MKPCTYHINQTPFSIFSSPLPPLSPPSPSPSPAHTPAPFFASAIFAPMKAQIHSGRGERYRCARCTVVHCSPFLPACCCFVRLAGGWGCCGHSPFFFGRFLLGVLVRRSIGVWLGPLHSMNSIYYISHSRHTGDSAWPNSVIAVVGPFANDNDQRNTCIASTPPVPLQVQVMSHRTQYHSG